ncbi:DUF6163 family protein [Pleomorphomonas sp. NRK KF1]|uniref:DUF6163 family protein n=1 Tax=Pleomorphomonas sp. NRK KF1 TaxID=2943000 RepID=UPI002043FA4B|nr:DUF6163 family protein [Pleomorphomonas sp. NRK KF1]MCM5552519.1 DUF6163 family protein [Pleomorphomonas sp. NRK KF1]
MSGNGDTRQSEGLETSLWSRFDARLTLVIYVRFLSTVFLVAGLLRWATILGFGVPSGNFLTLSSPVIVATLFFAVADLVAAVGLWLLASWGTVVWMISALTETALYGAYNPQFGRNYPLMIFHIGTVMLYAVLSAYYERTRDRL